MEIRKAIFKMVQKKVCLVRRLRGGAFSFITGKKFRSVGCHLKLRGIEAIDIRSNFSVGDFCWIEGVTTYSHLNYFPRLIIGSDVSLSDFVHISCVNHIFIGDGCLFGSNIYVGDHSHGTYKSEILLKKEAMVRPALRPLGDIGSISIGDNCWIGDGVVILPNTNIYPGSIVGANSVVKIHTDRPAIIAGIPAKIVKYLV